MDKTQEEINRGEEAARLLNHPLVKEFFDKAQQDLVDSMATSPLGDEKTHNRLVIALQVLNRLERSFQDVINTGKMAKIQVNESMADKVRNFARNRF